MKRRSEDNMDREKEVKTGNTISWRDFLLNAISWTRFLVSCFVVIRYIVRTTVDFWYPVRARLPISHAAGQSPDKHGNYFLSSARYVSDKHHHDASRLLFQYSIQLQSTTIHSKRLKIIQSQRRVLFSVQVSWEVRKNVLLSLSLQNGQFRYMTPAEYRINDIR